MGFNGELKQTLGEISLVVYTEGLNITMELQVIDAPLGYNVILESPWIHRGVPSTYH